MVNRKCAYPDDLLPFMPRGSTSSLANISDSVSIILKSEINLPQEEPEEPEEYVLDSNHIGRLYQYAY